jgi:phospholipid/cholesterol/gamma-HCH transport system substrate-binding protein
MAGRAGATGTVLTGRVFGVGFLTLLLFFVWLTYAFYSKKFVEYVPVDLTTSNIGMQLNTRADVKIRGMIVGQVRGIESDGQGAVLHLAMDPDKIEEIPANVTALLVPKTLFGEKYVALQVPEDPADESLEAGDVIEQATVPIEVEKVLADAYPLLEAVRPADLAYTLNAFSTALRGRGDRLGDNFARLGGYLGRFNPLVPQMIDDLEALGRVSNQYADVMPEFGRLMANSSITGRTLISKEAQINALFNEVAAMADTTRTFLEANGDNLIELNRVSAPINELLARYSPMYPCLIQGLNQWIPQGSAIWRDHTLHINIELLHRQPTGYSRRDDPKFNAHFGPNCQTLPQPPYGQHDPGPAPPPEVWEAHGVDGSHNKYRPAPGAFGSAPLRPTGDRVVNRSLSPMLGMAADAVPDVATLLLRPVATPGQGGR